MKQRHINRIKDILKTTILKKDEIQSMMDEVEIRITELEKKVDALENTNELTDSQEEELDSLHDDIEAYVCYQNDLMKVYSAFEDLKSELEDIDSTMDFCLP